MSTETVTVDRAFEIVKEWVTRGDVRGCPEFHLSGHTLDDMRKRIQSFHNRDSLLHPYSTIGQVRTHTDPDVSYGEVRVEWPR
jgi:hypothetical protein